MTDTRQDVQDEIRGENKAGLERRRFIKRTLAAGGGIMLGFVLSGRVGADLSRRGWQPNAWLEIRADGAVSIVVAESEMGQGVLTSMAMLVAEELEADWQKVRVQQAPVDPAFGWQGTGGSTSVRQGWKPLREAGATAREMLRSAAARAWRVPVAECVARNGKILHLPSGRRADYGDLAVQASREPVPQFAPLKKPDAFTLIGKPLRRVDTVSKINGGALFGADVRVPGMLYAAVVHCPVFGGKHASIQASAAQAIRGVRHVVPLGSAVAVVADSTWLAQQGAQALKVTWEAGVQGSSTSATIFKRLHAALEEGGQVVQDHPVGESDNARIARVIEAVYETPYQAHATMEPMCCTAHVRGSDVEIWAPTQQPTGLQRAVAKFMSGSNEPNRDALQRVAVHTTFLGGGFGRRNLHDFALEAVQISREVKAPVQLLWSREEDMQHGFYHPATVHRLRAGLDKLGRVIGWDHKLCGSAHVSGADSLPYSLAGQRLEKVSVQTVIPIGPWRSVSHAYTAYVVECFIDELAATAVQDPCSYRLAHIHDPRLRTVLQLAADKARWGKSLPKGRYHGVAVHASFGSHVAEIVELSIGAAGTVQVHKVVCVIDCGMVVNPDTVAAQMEGSIVWALTSALKGAITIQRGRVEQSNFHDYPLWRMDEMPEIEVHIVPSRAEPGGVGEPGVPPLAPALANAVYAATGKRIRRLPITAQDLRDA